MNSSSNGMVREVHSMKSVLEVQDLHMVFRVGKVEIHALKGVDLGVRPGEFVAVMGPSGCGKSTLLHILGGLLRPTSGQVLVDGMEVSALPDAERTEIRRRKIGFVFQRFNLMPTLTALDNIRLAQEIRKNGGTSGDIEELLALVGLQDKLGHKPSELSGGEQQRLGIVRAIICRPAILLADEPTGNLDSTNSEAVLTLLRTFNARYRQTIIMITHDAEAASYASRIVEMKDGKILGRVQNVVYAMGTGLVF